MRADEDDEEDDADDDEDAELVGRGAFRIDPSVAAEKLRDYQLPDAEDFLVPWLRAAVASGANRVEAAAADGLLTFSFDGAAPDPAVLMDLTAGLLQEDHGEPARHLAFGALALHRLAPASVTAQAQDGRTTIAVRWHGVMAPATGALGRLRAAYGMSATVLLLNGEVVTDPAHASPAVAVWEGKKTRVVVRRGAAPDGAGRLHVYKLGAFVETLPLDLGGPYDVFMAHNRFTLSLSQSSVLKDKRFDRRLRWVKRLRRRFPQREAAAAAPMSRGLEFLFRWWRKR